VLLAWAAAGATLSTLLWRVLRPTFEQPLFLRANHRGRSVPVGAGLVVGLAVVAGEAAAGVVASAGHPWSGDAGRFVTLATVLGFGVLGLVDDVAARGQDRGFSGHVRALAQGRLTTGGAKLLGGAVLAVAMVGALGGRGLGWLVVDAALVALAANLANLFDRAPGRCTKVVVLAFVVLAVASAGDRALGGAALAVGAAAGLLWPDLREELMLGDAGANPLGAALGLGVVLVAPGWVRATVVVVLLVLNMASERVSFSEVIDRTAPLRALDALGRRKD